MTGGGGSASSSPSTNSSKLSLSGHCHNAGTLLRPPKQWSMPEVNTPLSPVQSVLKVLAVCFPLWSHWLFGYGCLVKDTLLASVCRGGVSSHHHPQEEASWTMLLLVLHNYALLWELPSLVAYCISFCFEALCFYIARSQLLFSYPGGLVA